MGYNVGGYELGLLADETPGEPKTANVLSYWGVDDIEAAVQGFLSHGASPNEPPVNVGGEIMVPSVKESWGNVIGFIHNPAFKLQ